MLFDYENRPSIKAEKNTGQSVKHITGMVNSGSIKSSLRQLPVKSVCSLPDTSSSGCFSAESSLGSPRFPEFGSLGIFSFRSLRHVDDPETVAAEFGQGFPLSANPEEIHMHQDSQRSQMLFVPPGICCANRLCIPFRYRFLLSNKSDRRPLLNSILFTRL